MNTATSKTRNKKNIAPLIIMILYSCLMIIPFLWMVSTSLKSDSELAFNQGFIPWDWEWGNYVEAWKMARFSVSFKNSALITVLGMVGSLLSNSFVAYGFAKFRFKGKNILFTMVLATMMIPSYTTLIPQYVLFAKLGWVKTFLPLIVPTFLGSPFYIFLFRQFILGIPNDYIEAARLEGAGEIRIFAQLIVPLIRPALISVAIFEFNAKWNEFFSAMIYLQSEKLYTVQLTLRGMLSTGGNDWQVFMAAAGIALMPVLIVFFLLQRYFVEGVGSAGIK